MPQTPHLYLFTLEVAPLEIGMTYNPLPSHLTLVSRFFLDKPPNHIINKVSALFKLAECIELVFEELSTIGPEHTEVHVIKPNKSLEELHTQITDNLVDIGVSYTHPEYIKEGWKPHISKRDNDNYVPGYSFLTHAAYLIEVHIQDGNYLRTIREKFNLLR